MSLNGAIAGFFMAYAIPIAAHLVCYHKETKEQEKKEVYNPEEETVE